MSVRPLSKILQEKAQTEINENSHNLSENIKHIKKWLDENSQFMGRKDDQFIAAFLRGCKHDLQVTKRKMKLFYQLKEEYPQFFQSRDPHSEEIQNVLKAGYHIPLLKTADPCGPTVMITRVSSRNSDETTVTSILKVMFLFMEYLMINDDRFTILGQHLIIDLKNMPYKFLLQLTPSLLKQASFCTQHVFPVRLKGFHFINTPLIFHPILNIAKKFAASKLRARIHIHATGACENLDPINVPISILPVEYGGQEGSLTDLEEIWRKNIEQFIE